MLDHIPLVTQEIYDRDDLDQVCDRVVQFVDIYMQTKPHTLSNSVADVSQLTDDQAWTVARYAVYVGVCRLKTQYEWEGHVRVEGSFDNGISTLTLTRIH